ncbi:diguanylate cyclase [bacterium]|nr:diguanylate cyclase [bacterium]MCI0604329.1 diguanylate cyclase [bacterium]
MFINNPRSHDRTPEPGAPSEIEQLRTLLYTDDLTGLYNRRFFRHCVSEQKNQSDNANIPFALLIMDVDHFKQINDTQGHAVGDQVLIQVAATLKEELRDRGWLFRYAGDEFVALVRNGNDEYVRTLCSRLLQKVAALSNKEEISLDILSISIGYSIYPNDTRSIGDLLEAADRALYASKHAGRNTIHSAREINAKEKHSHGKDWPIPVQCPSLIGRQHQWNLLQHHFFECRNGRGRLVFLTGEAGIGKSRLIKHFVRRQRASDYHFLLGECTEATIVHSYGPLRDALKKGFEAKDPATVNVYKELGEAYRKVLLDLVPQFDRFEKTPLVVTSSTDRYFILESIFLLLQGLSRQLPTVLVLEDLHWSDEATLNLLQFLAKNIHKEKLLLIVTLREEEALNSIIPSILQSMSRENLYDKIEVKPLSFEETSLMLGEIFRGYPVSQALQEWIYSEAEGIPFYVEELLKLLIDEAYLNRAEDEIRLRTPDKFILPYSIRALIHRRIQRLDDPSRKLLSLAAIIGKEFSLETLVRLTGENEGQLLDLLENLTRIQLIHEQTDRAIEQFCFHHNKIRDVIYDEIGHVRRKKYHRDVAGILEQLHANEVQLYAEDLAYHFENAEEPAKAGYYSLIAGKKALQIHAYLDAFHHFHRCFEYSKREQQDLSNIFTEDMLVELYTQQGMALEALGRWDEAVQSYELLFQMPGNEQSAPVHVDAWNHLSRVFYKRENFTKALSLSESALKEAERQQYRPGISASHQNVGRIYWRLSQYDKALHHMNAALAMIEGESENEKRSKLLNSKGIILLEQSLYTDALMAFQEALLLAQKEDHRIGMIESLVNMSLIEHLLGKLHDARQRVIRAFALAQESADPISIAACSVNQAELEFKLANYELGNRLNEKAGKIYEELNHSHGITYFLENQSHLSMVQGHLEHAMEIARHASTLASERGLKKRRLELLRIEANLHYLMGHYEDGFRLLDQVTLKSQEIGDLNSEADAQFRKGLYFMRLNDLKRALPYWPLLMNLPEDRLSAELAFLKVSVKAFHACAEHREQELQSLQREMKQLSEATDYAYLMIGTPMICVHQMEHLNRLPEALRFAEDAERQALYYNQDVWLPRVRIKIFELQKVLRRPPAIPKVYELLDMAKLQGQNHIVHSCYQLLWEIDPRFESLQKDWRHHWENWKTQIPEQYRESLRPAFED